jgi:hypothetical protein
MLICQKYVFFGNFNQQISFFYKIVKTFLLVIACSQNYELRMQLNSLYKIF